MGQNAIEDAVSASFHIINIAGLSSRRGIYKNEMTSGLSSQVQSRATQLCIGVQFRIEISKQLSVRISSKFIPIAIWFPHIKYKLI